MNEFGLTPDFQGTLWLAVDAASGDNHQNWFAQREVEELEPIRPQEGSTVVEQVGDWPESLPWLCRVFCLNARPSIRAVCRDTPTTVDAASPTANGGNGA